MSDFTFNTTPSIRQVWGGAQEFGATLAEQPFAQAVRRVLMVTDPGVRGLGLCDPCLDSLSAAGFEVSVFDAVESDPKSETVLAAADVARDCDLVVGFGGGSSMDVAKVVAFLARSTQPLDALYGVGLARGARLPLVLVPTTAGTGSEVTPISILTTGTVEKKGIVSPLLLPDMALLDASLTVGLPPAITAATGVDAMVHAIEAYTSRSANNNAVSRALAGRALELLGANIRTAVADGTNREAREAMLLGSMLAGQAFANSPVGAVHALAYPVGSLFHVPHGLSNALVLAEVMRFNLPDAAQGYAEIAPRIFPDIDMTRGTQAIAVELIDRLAQLNADLALGPGLRSVGIADSDIAKLANDVMNQTRLLVNNPREVTRADAERIYRTSL